MRLLLTLCVLGLVVVGCSDKPEKPVFLGDRLLATAVKGDDGSYYLPQLESVEKALPECKFKELGESFYLAADCSFENAAPDRKKSPEILKIYLTSSRSGVNAITIDQAQMDFEDGLSLFGKLKGIKVEKLSCPDIEIDNSASLNSNFYNITKSGMTIGVYRVDYYSGSGGADRSTSLYLGMTDAPCKWSEDTDKRLRKAIQSQLNVSQNSSSESNLGNSIFFNSQGKLDKSLLLTTPKGIPIYSCEGNVSDAFRRAMYQAVVDVSKTGNVTPPKDVVCTIVGFSLNGQVTFDIGFWGSRSSLDRCYASVDQNCLFNNVTNVFNENSNRATVMATSMSPLKQVTGCVDLASGRSTPGFCQ